MDGRGAVKGFEPSDKTIPEISLDVSAPLPVAEASEDMMTREVNQSELFTESVTSSGIRAGPAAVLKTPLSCRIVSSLYSRYLSIYRIIAAIVVFWSHKFELARVDPHD
jgi:hypothetical protein